ADMASPDMTQYACAMSPQPVAASATNSALQPSLAFDVNSNLWGFAFHNGSSGHIELNAIDDGVPGIKCMLDCPVATTNGITYADGVAIASLGGKFAVADGARNGAGNTWTELRTVTPPNFVLGGPAVTANVMGGYAPEIDGLAVGHDVNNNPRLATV